MSLQHIEDRLSDDEIFIGRQLTIKEVKKRVFPENYRQTVGCVSMVKHEDQNTSLKIIDTHSAPDVSPKAEALSYRVMKSSSSPGLSPEVVSDWDIKPDDSFLKIEKMVSALSVSPTKEGNEVYESKVTGAQKYFFRKQSDIDLNFELKDFQESLNSLEPCENTDVCVNKDTPVLVEYDEDIEYKTPLKNNYTNSKVTVTPSTPRVDIFATPSNDLKNKTSAFKTPRIPVSNKKSSVTPSRKFQHVVSPVATYIKKCPMVPLVKDVCPKKPLPGHSSIPKPIKHTPCSNKSDKENFKLEHSKPEVVKQGNMKLPSVAYRSAKETKVIDIPDQGKLPQSQWAKQVASSIPRAFVMKHNSREVKSATKAFQQKPEDSFADLSLQQADLSVCTQKSAFNNLRKIL